MIDVRRGLLSPGFFFDTVTSCLFLEGDASEHFDYYILFSILTALLVGQRFGGLVSFLSPLPFFLGGRLLHIWLGDTCCNSHTCTYAPSCNRWRGSFDLHLMQMLADLISRTTLFKLSALSTAL